MTLDEVRDELKKGMRTFLYLEEAEGGGYALRYAVGTRNHQLVQQGMNAVGAHFAGGKGPEQYEPNRLTNYWDDTQSNFRCFAIERFLGFVDGKDTDWGSIYEVLQRNGIQPE